MKKTVQLTLLISLAATLSLQANEFTDAFSSTKEESKKAV